MQSVLKEYVEEGQAMLDTLLWSLSHSGFDSVGITLEKVTVSGSAERLWLPSKRKKILDMRTGEPVEQDVIYGDSYRLDYEFHPLGRVLRGYPLGEKGIRHEDREGCERRILSYTAVIVSSILREHPEKQITLTIPDDILASLPETAASLKSQNACQARRVDERLIQELGGPPYSHVVAVLSTVTQP